ncbi:hypothetical protein [uncultured Methylobacterium sp.]|jgi:hypothetical protein|uniref:hypothetical protein n=1 Tax=uncultured Methylobacterium sp. TaxID=157278 RepID=UPI0026340512|nr:hypothetical protein [uncultured Methylobacterium sp.]
MTGPEACRYYSAEGPADEAPDLPLRSFYEIDHADDAVTRAVDILPDGRVIRDSLALERRNGDDCPSLIDTPLAEFLADAPLVEIDRAAFEAEWARGEDQPFWFP